MKNLESLRYLNYYFIFYLILQVIIFYLRSNENEFTHEELNEFSAIACIAIIIIPLLLAVIKKDKNGMKMGISFIVLILIIYRITDVYFWNTQLSAQDDYSEERFFYLDLLSSLIFIVVNTILIIILHRKQEYLLKYMVIYTFLFLSGMSLVMNLAYNYLSSSY